MDGSGVDRGLGTRSGPAKVGSRGLFSLPEVLFSLLIAGTLYINLGPANLGVSDPILAVSAFLYVIPASVLYHSDRFASLLKRVGVPFLALVFLSLVLLVLVGGSAIIVVKNIASVSYLFVGVGLLALARTAPRFTLPKAATLLLSAALSIDVLLTPGSDRPTGTFENPNHTGNWIAAAALVLLCLKFPARAWLRYPAIALLLMATFASGSLGALSAFLVGAAMFWVGRGGRSSVQQYLAMPVALILAIIALPQISAFTRTDRLDRSRSTRETLWASVLSQAEKHPFGLGPGGLGEISGLIAGEAHNDYLDFLADYGLVGLLLWLAVLVGLFTTANSGLPMVAFLAVSSLTHSAINYRHIWLFMALVFAVDYWAGNSTARPLDEPRELTPPLSREV